MKKMTTAERFFYDHAGYSYNAAQGETRGQGRRRCAVELAAAELWASREQGGQDLCMCWEQDSDPDLSFMSDEDKANVREVLVCVARYPDGTVAASLGGIIDPDANHSRVIEAELALEAQADFWSALEQAI